MGAALLYCLCVSAPECLAQKTIAYDADKALWRQIQTLIETKTYGPATLQLEQWLAGEHNPALEPEAAYWLAHCRLKLDVPTAVNELVAFEEKYPDSPYAGRAMADRASYYYAQKDYGRVTEVLTYAKAKALPVEYQPEAFFKLGYSHLTRKQFGKADTAFAAIKQTEHAYTAAANYYAGYLAVKNNKLDDAVRSLEKAEKDSAFARMTPLLRTVVYFRNKQWDKAIASGEKYLSDTSKVSGADELMRLVAESYYNKSKYADAAKYYNQYLELNPKNNTIGLRYRIGYSMFMGKEYAKATTQFDKVIAMVPDSALTKDSTAQFALYYNGVALINQGNTALAATNLDRARQNTANAAVRELSWYNYGKLLIDQEKFDDAVTALKAFQKEFGKSKYNDEVSELVSEALLNSNNFDEALRYMLSLKKRTQRTDLAFQRVNYLKGLSLYNDNKFGEAIPYFGSSLNVTDDSSTAAAAALLLAESMMQTKKYADALGRYKQAMKFGGNLAYYKQRGRLGVAYAHYNQKDYDKASTAFKDYLNQLDTASMGTQVAEAYVRLGDCAYVRKQYRDATRWYADAIRTGGYDADYAAYQKGLTHVLADEDASAITSFEMLAKDYPGSPYRDLGLYQKANIYFKKSNYEQAVTAFTEVINQQVAANLMAQSLLKRAQAQNNLKNYDAAATDFKRIIDDYANSGVGDDAILGLQETVAHTNATEELATYLSRYKTQNPDSKSTQSVEFETAKSLFFSQKYDLAIGAFNSFLSAYPEAANASDAQYYLGESYFRKNDRANSIKFHKLVLAQTGASIYNKSLNRLAELSLSGGEYAAAKGYYGELATKAKSKKEAVAGTLGLMEACFNLGNLDTTLIIANQVLTMPGTPQDAQNRATLYRAKVAISKNELDKATDDLLTVVNNAKDVTGAEAMYYTADVLYKQGRFNESIETLFDLNKTYSGYPKWYDKSFLLIADNYISIKKPELARYTLQNVVDKSPNPTNRAEAKRKLESLTQ